MASDSGAESEGVVSVSDFCLILTTNMPGELRNALLSRVSLKIALEPYSETEMREIVIFICEKKDLAVSSQGVTVLAMASRGIPRRANDWVNLVHNYYPNPEGELTKSDICTFLDDNKFCLETMLNAYEQQYIRALNGQNKPVFVGHLAKMLGVDRKFIFEEIEFSLIKDGFVEVAPKGRRLTQKGVKTANRLITESNNQRGTGA